MKNLVNVSDTGAPLGDSETAEVVGSLTKGDGKFGRDERDVDSTLEKINSLLSLQEEYEISRQACFARVEAFQKESCLTSSLLHCSLGRTAELDAEMDDRRTEIMERQKYLTAVETLLMEEAEKSNSLRQSLETLKSHKEEQLELIGVVHEHLMKTGVDKNKLNAVLRRKDSVERTKDHGGSAHEYVSHQRSVHMQADCYDYAK
eukprot:jgi/Picsp_1/1734/NSC_05206-R1_---NA---